MTAADCLFCRIVAGDADATIVRDTSRLVAFRDINPQAPTHVLIIPREHYADAAALAEAEPDLLAGLFREGAAIAADEGLSERGYRLVFNTGREAQQSVPHVHLHLMGGRAFTWPPG